MAIFAVRTGLLLALICPAIILVAYLIWPLMPQCQAGSIGPATGCILLGMSLDWFMDLFVIAFLGAFLLVPGGLLLAIAGMLLGNKTAD